MDLGIVLLYQPIYNLLVVFYRFFGGDLGLAIIAIALLFRIITFPITMRQIQMAKTNKEFTDKVNEIKKQFKNNKEKQTEEMMKIQSEYLPGQLSGCFSMILQLLVLINVFNVVSNLLRQGAESFNQVAYSFVPQFVTDYPVNTNFLGIDLTASASSVGYESILAVLPYVVLAVMVGVVQYASSKILMGMRTKDAKPEEADQVKKKSTDEPPSFAEIMQQSTKQTMMILPVLITFMSLSFPAGLSIYWTAQSGFVIIQQFIIEKLRREDPS